MTPHHWESLSSFEKTTVSLAKVELRLLRRFLGIRSANGNRRLGLQTGLEFRRDLIDRVINPRVERPADVTFLGIFNEVDDPRIRQRLRRVEHVLLPNEVHFPV